MKEKSVQRCVKKERKGDRVPGVKFGGEKGIPWWSSEIVGQGRADLVVRE